jgi:hypothetical protein
MKKLLIALTTIILLIPDKFASAVCPVCTVAVAAGMGLTRYLGIDDTITGVWIGAVTLSATMWTNNWFKTKNKGKIYIKSIVFLLYYALIIFPLYYYNIIGQPTNTFWGIDKLVTGIIAGSIIFYMSVLLYEYLKKKNNGHAHFPFEKIVITLLLLAGASAGFYFIT